MLDRADTLSVSVVTDWLLGQDSCILFTLVSITDNLSLRLVPRSITAFSIFTIASDSLAETPTGWGVGPVEIVGVPGGGAPGGGGQPVGEGHSVVGDNLGQWEHSGHSELVGRPGQGEHPVQGEHCVGRILRLG